MTTLVESAREALGPVGAFLPVQTTSAPPADQQREAVRRLERAGYRAAWTNEAGGKDALVQIAVLLAATERMVFGTGIANIWSRSPQTAQVAANVHEYLDGGADHVTVGGPIGSDFAAGIDHLERIASVLAGI
ncbi:MAG: LLM class flavin-dependent oxidoreductase [Streptosporangiaceae bacterium]